MIDTLKKILRMIVKNIPSIFISIILTYFISRKFIYKGDIIEPRSRVDRNTKLLNHVKTLVLFLLIIVLLRILLTILIFTPVRGKQGADVEKIDLSSFITAKR